MTFDPIVEHEHELYRQTFACPGFDFWDSRWVAEVRETVLKCFKKKRVLLNSPSTLIKNREDERRQRWELKGGTVFLNYLVSANTFFKALKLPFSTQNNKVRKLFGFSPAGQLSKVCLVVACTVHVNIPKWDQMSHNAVSRYFVRQMDS